MNLDATMNPNDLLIDVLVDEDDCLTDMTSQIKVISFTYQDATFTKVNRNGTVIDSDMEEHPDVEIIDNEDLLVQEFWGTVVQFAGGFTADIEQPMNGRTRFYGWELTDKVWPIMVTKAIYYNSLHQDPNHIKVPKGLMADLSQRWFRCDHLINVDVMYKQGRAPMSKSCKLNGYQGLAYLSGLYVDDLALMPDTRRFTMSDFNKLQAHMKRMAVLLKSYWWWQ